MLASGQLVRAGDGVTSLEVLEQERARRGQGTAKGAAPLAVQLDGIAQSYGGRFVLRGVTLQVAPGEVVALVGKNGSGKTTLLRIVSTLLRPRRGAGSVFGSDLLRDAAGVRRHVAMLGHATGLYEDLTAEENLRFAARMTGMAHDRSTLTALLAEVGLERERSDRVRGFSAGMQRRLALARLRLRAPRLLLLDEPYNTVDEEGTALVNRLLTDTRAAGGAAILVTHDLTRGSTVVDRVARLVDGKVA